MADYLPYIQGIPSFSGVTASATIVGGQVLENTGVNTVGPAGANSLKVVGVAAHDAAVGAGVTVHPIGPGNTHETTTVGTVTAGDRVATAAAGTVGTVVAATAAAAGYDIGVALNTATTGNKVRWTGR